MTRTICPITEKPFDCLECLAIKDDEKCPYMVFDKAVEFTLKFLAKRKEKENEK